jgi:23S rRNA (uracil1939-C5)-methyltransferase
MVEQALDWLELGPSDTVLDLFCGIGNFTLPLAQRVREVIAVEGVSTMVERLRHNAEINKLDNIQGFQADLSQIEPKKKPKWLTKVDKLLLDPARDGAFDVVKKIPLFAPKQILYVSCNPATMMRDLKELLNSGYRINKIGLINMFPHTSHVEAMALLDLTK